MWRRCRIPWHESFDKEDEFVLRRAHFLCFDANLDNLHIFCYALNRWLPSISALLTIIRECPPNNFGENEEKNIHSSFPIYAILVHIWRDHDLPCTIDLNYFCGQFTWFDVISTMPNITIITENYLPECWTNIVYWIIQIIGQSNTMRRLSFIYYVRWSKRMRTRVNRKKTPNNIIRKML